MVSGSRRSATLRIARITKRSTIFSHKEAQKHKTKLKILITGAKGLVGRALVEHCSASGDEVFGYDHQALDIADTSAVESMLLAKRPDAVINCAAWTDVDGCESNPEKAERVNALGPENLAHACRK